MAKRDDILLEKRGPAGDSRAGATLRRVLRLLRAAGLVAGGFVTQVFGMSVVGLVTDNFWVRFVLAIVVVVGLPTFLSDRLLRRTKFVGAGAGLVVDVFAVVYLGAALIVVSADFASRPLLEREGDRYARSGARTMARVVYFLAGVRPAFPDDAQAAPPAASASTSAAAPSASGASSK